MATTTVEITIKPKGKMDLQELKNEIENIESLADMNVVGTNDVTIELDTDYNDDSRVLVARWTV